MVTGFMKDAAVKNVIKGSLKIELILLNLLLKHFSFRKKEKRMLYDYNNKLQALIREKVNIIRQLERENNTIKEFKEVIIR